MPELIFESAQSAARLGEQVGNGRGYTFLKTAYSFAGFDENYKREAGITGSLEVQKRFCVVQSAKCGSLESKGNLAEIFEKEGRSNDAERHYRDAADAGFAKHQYHLGVLLCKLGQKEDGLRYLQEADRNEFDVSGSLSKAKDAAEKFTDKIILDRMVENFTKNVRPKQQ